MEPKGQKLKLIKRPRMNFKGLCPLCQTTSLDILNHFSIDHEIEIESEDIEFDDEISFLKWKKDVEKSTKSLFVISKSRKEKGRNNKTFRFTCHRSGVYQSRGKNIRHLKTKKSNKIGGCCPAGLYVTVDKHSQRRYGIFVKTHVGHKDDNLLHLNLSKEFRLSIAEDIAKGIPFDRILDNNRNSIAELEENAEPERSHLLTRKDLHNIKALLDLKDSSICKSDSASVDEWVNENSDCVLLYKNQDQVVVDIPLEKDDFILIVMNRGQRNMLQKYGSDVICMDVTNGPNPDDFQMHTLMVLDDLRQGFPCAFMFSNKNDENTLRIFLQSIKKEAGVINCRVLMTDVPQQYYNSWKYVMNDPKYKLFCMWHVDAAWRQNLIKVPASRRSEVHQFIRNMLEETYQIPFEEMLNTFLNDYEEELLDFVRYFYWYAERKTSWAFCYQRNAGVNTNMHLERMHSLLKNVYLKNNRVQRLDKAIYALMDMIRNKLFNRVITSHKGKLTSKLSAIRKRHEESEQGNPSSIIIADGGWHVPSFRQESKTSEVYFIVETDKNCNCQLVCEPCNTCIHRFSCSCADNTIRWNFCKHIHLLCKYLRSDDYIGPEFSSIVMETDQTNDDSEEIYSLLRFSDIQSETFSEDFDILRKEFEDLLSNASTEKEIDIIRRALQTAKIRVNAVRASRNRANCT